MDDKMILERHLGPVAPLVCDAWYVIDLAAGFERKIKARSIVNIPLVYYRTEAGQPVVMDGRCPHRNFPMSEGTLVGDSVVCGYHGFTYTPSGKCSFAPGCPSGVPESIKIRTYPIFEAGPWIWVWMGQGEPDMDEFPLPADMLDGRQWHLFAGETAYDCNYGLVHENLLDLSHVHFLHKVGTLEYADQPLKFLSDGRVGWYKSHQDMVNVYGYFTGAGWEPMVHFDEFTETLGPGLMVSYTDISPVDETSSVPSRGIVMQAVTPETDRKTAQFWLAGTDLPMAVTLDEYRDVVADIYGQDQHGLRLQQETLDADRREKFVEVSIPNDRASFLFRRRILNMTKGKKWHRREEGDLSAS